MILENELIGVSPVTADDVERALRSPCVGYVMAAEGAWWFRADGRGAVEHAPSAPARRSPFEIVAFDGTEVLRWRRTDGRAGAVRLDGVPGDAFVVETLLAGAVVAATAGWVTVVGRLRTAFEVPVVAGVGQRIVLKQAESVSVDEQGNARVADTLPVLLVPMDDRSAEGDGHA